MAKGSDIWEAGSEVMELVQFHISNNHPNLALVDKEIAVIFRGKASKSGGQKVLGKTRKAGPLFKILGKSEYKYVLEIANDEWLTLSNDQRSALVDHLLCACNVTETDDGDVKCSLASPEVSFYWGELKRHGNWRPTPEESEDGKPSESVGLDVEAAIGTQSE